mmetsp:Transcript_6615/g.11511  ORF Transcript_6615/g.11511 Transcript_6615/m.11511 type:complete len:368 (+) Transcript_6615:56-1159(+)
MSFHTLGRLSQAVLLVLTLLAAGVGAARPADDLDLAEVEPFDLDDVEDGSEGDLEGEVGETISTGDEESEEHTKSDLLPDLKKEDHTSNGALEQAGQSVRLTVGEHSFVEADSNKSVSSDSVRVQKAFNWQKCKQKAVEFHDTAHTVINDWNNPNEWKKIGDTLEMILGESEDESPVLTLLTVVRIIQGEMGKMMEDIEALTTIANNRQAYAGMKKIVDTYFNPDGQLIMRFGQMKLVRKKDVPDIDLLGDFINVVSATPAFGQYFRKFYPRKRGKQRGPHGEILIYWYPYEVVEQILFIGKKYFHYRWIDFFEYCTPEGNRYVASTTETGEYESVERSFWKMAEVISSMPGGDWYSGPDWRKPLAH